MNHHLTSPLPIRRLNAALAVAVSAIVLAGCGPQAASPPAPPVAMAPAVNAGGMPVQQQPQQSGGGQANVQYPAIQAQPVPTQTTQGQYPAQAPNGSVQPQAQAQRYDAPPQPVPYAAPVYQDGPPPVAQPYPAPAHAAAPAPRPHRQPVASQAQVQVASHRIGRVASIEPIRERPQGSGAGGVVGGVLGAVVGNQFGHGNGRAALTVLGGVGGAVAGNNVERNIKERVVGYRINIVLDDGGSRTYEETSTEGLRVGDRVRVEGNALRRI